MEIPRPAPPRSAPEREMLEAWLDFHRMTLERKWTHRRERATDGNKDMASFRLTIRHWHSRAFLPDFEGSQPKMKAKRAGSG